MEKLIELLKQKDGYENVDYQKQSDGGYMFWLDGIAYREERICSKKFGFIKWLVDNDKIDLVKFSDKLSSSSGTMEDRYKYLNSDFGLYNSILMLLAIQDEPINFLISILKNV